ncbi:glycosyltransferase family A protein [Lactococcus lactis]|uniref:glycosyltransferase family A protein n=1 Tax=Lactococcus lactis TaxID=1358 RepID=UPI001F086B21|nr:glycosyltransferase family A protein [Lactococcus lactis]
MKKVSIIIPFKGQTEAELMLPLSSIYNQIGVDLSQLDIHLVNDGGKTIDLSKFDVLADRLEIHYHEIPNGGPGVARQYGIDNSISEYIMFIDADDVLYYVGALWPFYNASNQGHQMIRASYWEQIAPIQFMEMVTARQHTGSGTNEVI